MALRIVGAGFGRTGTLSLKNALEPLGFASEFRRRLRRGQPNRNAKSTGGRR